MNLRILKSSTSSSLNSCLEAYQRLRQSSITPTRKPVGFTFWPIVRRPSARVDRGLLILVFVGVAWRRPVGQADLDVRAASADHVGHAPGARHQPLERRAAMAPGVDDEQVAHVADALVLGVG